MGERESPLRGYADRFAAATAHSGGAVRIAELPFLAQLDLRLDPKGRAAESVGLALGVPLPLEPGTTEVTAGHTILWLGPDEWLVVAPPGSERDVAAQVRAAVGAEHASVVDVSARRTTLGLAGSCARDVLAHGCALDLHPRAFGTGRCAQTMLARAPVVLAALPGDAFWVLVGSSYARYLADWLLDAATEYVEGAGIGPR